MSVVLFYIFLPLIYLLSILPMRLLYVISDGLFVLVYHVVGYRKKVVRENLKNSFPDKSEKERLKIEKQFFHYLCDLILEVVKALTISKKEFSKRMKTVGDECMTPYFKEGKSVAYLLGHYGNWEWGSLTNLLTDHWLTVIYHEIKNPRVDKLMSHMRTRFGTRVVRMEDTLRFVINNRKDVTVTAFVGDQTPPSGGAHWMTWMNQDTGIFKGVEKISKKFDLPIIYLTFMRTKRGYYEMRFEELVSNPKDHPDGEITEMHARRLEKDIHEAPQYWMWSHRRWKHKRPDAAL